MEEKYMSNSTKKFTNMKLIYKILNLRKKKRQPTYDVSIFMPRRWLDKEVDEAMFKKAFRQY